MKRRAAPSPSARRFIPSLILDLRKFLTSLFQAFPSFPLAELRQAILGIERPIALLARETARQLQNPRFAEFGNKPLELRSEILRTAK